MGELLRGSAAAKSVEEDLRRRVAALKERGVAPALAVARIGDREEDSRYLQGAARRAERVGIAVETFAFAESVTEEQLVNEMMNLSLDDAFHGVLLLRPLPPHIGEAAVAAALCPNKDVDGITDGSLAGLMKKRPEGFAPCTAEACVEILRQNHIPVRGKKVTVIGRSLVVGKPLALMLLALDATVTVCHTKTENLAAAAADADILIAAAGRAGLVTSEFVKPGAVVIDVGINAGADGGITGDVNFEDAEKKAGRITPVPGGVGPLTTAILARHVVEAAERSAAAAHSSR